jgi:hypothetical protein
MLNITIKKQILFFCSALVLSTVLITPIKGYADVSQPWLLFPSPNPYNNIYWNSYVKVSGNGATNSQPKAPIDVTGGLYPFRVSRSADQNYGVVIGHDQNSGIGTINAWQNNGTSLIYKPLTLNAPGGNVGINGYSANFPLDVNGIINTNSNVQASGNISAGGIIYAQDNGKPAGATVLQVGDDVNFTDLDQANTFGIQGAANSTQVRIKLGTNGGWLTSNNGEVCLGAC